MNCESITHGFTVHVVFVNLWTKLAAFVSQLMLSLRGKSVQSARQPVWVDTVATEPTMFGASAPLSRLTRSIKLRLECLCHISLNERSSLSLVDRTMIVCSAYASYLQLLDSARSERVDGPEPQRSPEEPRAPLVEALRSRGSPFSVCEPPEGKQSAEARIGRREA